MNCVYRHLDVHAYIEQITATCPSQSQKLHIFVRICKKTILKWLSNWFNESAVLKYKKDALSLLNKRFIKVGHIREIEPNLQFRNYS